MRVRILFVDDEISVLDGLKRALRSHRHRWDMSFALGGAAALTECAKAPFDVIVSDMRMPGMDGFALLSEVRNRWPSTIRFVLSGQTEKESMLRFAPFVHRFLTKPCETMVLVEEIDRACNLKSLITNDTVRDVVVGIGTLPALPQTVTDLANALSLPDVSLATFCEIIKRDISTCAKLLQVVNSPFFGIASKISDIEAAIRHLGINLTRHLFLALTAFGEFSDCQKSSTISWEAVQAHCAFTGVIASKIIQNGSPEEALMAGMLHDLGKIVLANRLPDQYLVAITEAENRNADTPFWMVEKEICNVDHAEIGAFMLGLWGVAFPVVEAVAFHHQPSRSGQKKFGTVGAVHVADWLAHRYLQIDNVIQAPSKPQLDTTYLQQTGVMNEISSWNALAESLIRASAH